MLRSVAVAARLAPSCGATRHVHSRASSLCSSLASSYRVAFEQNLSSSCGNQRAHMIIRRFKATDAKPEATNASATSGSGTGSAGTEAGRSVSSEASSGRGPVSWATLGLVLTVGAGALLYFNIKREEKKVQAHNKVETFGRPALGGPWTLVDAEGKPVTSGDLLGKFYLLYFGFTYCPDICPNELVKMGKVTDAVQKRALASGMPDVTPVFVTLDPYRDSCAQVGAYVKDFHPRMLGLTGTPAQLKKIAKSFRVYFQETDHDDGSEDYLVDHSIVMYLIGPDGTFLDFYTQMMTSPEITEKVMGTITATMPPPLSSAEKLMKLLGFGK